MSSQRLITNPAAPNNFNITGINVVNIREADSDP